MTYQTKEMILETLTRVKEKEAERKKNIKGMTIKKMIQTLQEFANTSEYGMDTKVLFKDGEWGNTDISRMFLSLKDEVIIIGED